MSPKPILRTAALAVVLACACLSWSGPARAQARDEGPDGVVDAARRRAVVAGALERLLAGYVFPATAQKAADHVRARAAAGAYDGLSGARAFAQALTDDLQAISKDKHLRVRYSAEPLGDPREPTAEEQRQAEDEARWRNHGFERVERLPGNVGYLELRGFADARLGGETAAAAMTFLAGTDALIVDLRRNGGGSAEMIALVSSYLFPERTHLNDFYWREGERHEQSWTQPWVPGRRFGGDKPVYVLTSAFTFSAAEEFTYNLKNLKRATVVGETTGGGAHPGGLRRIDDHFSIWVPGGRAINPVSKTNWEGTGVQPDVAVAAPEALRAAHAAALRKLLEAKPDERRGARLREALAEVERAPSS